MGLRPAVAQIAITEVLTTEAGSPGPTAGSDFFELTNFGTNYINLADFVFADDKDTPRVKLVQDGDPPLVLGPEESAIFVRTDTNTTPNVTQFREWWGECLPDQVQIRMYGASPGFSSSGDQVKLYNSTGELVEEVSFGAAQPGVSFTSDPVTGEFGALSVPGECGACWAAIKPDGAVLPDLASPGEHCGRIALGIMEQPKNVGVCAGTEAIFAVRAAGLPRPKYQWHFEGTPILGATRTTLTIQNATPDNAGAYSVEITNDQESLRSTNATLTVSSSPTAPNLVAPPADIEVYTGQAASFAVTVCAFPLPSYQWTSNGVPIDGATERTLRIENCQVEMSGTEFCVRIENVLGVTNACARLTVTLKPQLKITEVFASPLPLCPQNGDWFEVTNFGTNAANVLGYRFLDAYKLGPAIRITNAVIILPGESVIFAERMTPETLLAWWGADNLPPGLKIIRFAGFGLKHTGGELYLWNAAAEDLGDTVDGVAYAGAPPGISLRFHDPDCHYGCNSVAGADGAFAAATCGDVGSPGYVENPPPRFVHISRVGSDVILQWRAVESRRYRLGYKADLTEPDWKEVGTYVATNSVHTVVDASVGNDGRRFYRLEE